MMKHAKRLLALLAAVALLLISGCQGGSASSGAASGTTSSPAGGTTPAPEIDPVAQWRYTPEVVSKNPADRDFRLNAMDYESIAWPEYSKNDPARLVEYTDEEKKQQRLAGSRFKRELLQAIIGKTASMTVEPGVYRFVAGDIPVELHGVKDFTLIGEGVEFIMEGYQRVFDFVDCQNITIVGFTIDRDPYRHTQFTVLDYDWDTDELKVEVMEGYEPEDAPEAGDLQFFADDGTWRQHVFTHYTSFEWIDKENRIGVYYGVNPAETAVNDWLIGTIGATILHGGYTVMYLTRCDSCHFVDITNYGGAMMAGGVANTGTCYFLRNKDMTRPGTNSLIAGGFGLVEWINGGPIVEDSIYCRTNDDAMDILAWNSVLYKQESPNTLLVAVMSECPFSVGDTVRLYATGQGDWLAEAKVIAVENVFDEEMMKDAQTVLEDGRWYAFGNQESLVRLTLDQDVSVKVGDIVENYSDFRPDQVVIKGTLFHDVFCRVLIQGPKETVLENNVFMRTGLPALLLCNDISRFSEGKTLENVTIRGNTFVDSPWSQYTTYGTGILTGAIAIGIGDNSNGSNLTKPFSNITIEDNWFVRPMFSAIQVKNTDGLVIRNNRIDSPVIRAGLSPNNPINPGQPYYGAPQNAAIFLYACANITVENNTVNRGEGYCEQDVVKLHCE